MILLAVYILIGVMFDCFDLGVKAALGSVTGGRITQAALFSFIMTLGSAFAPKNKPKEEK